MESVETRRGFAFGVAAYLAWGLSPIYWRWMRDIDASQLLGYRVLCSLPMLALVITATHGWPRLRAAYRTPRTRGLAAMAGALLAVNWGVFIWASQSGHILDASLGYYINPLMSVALAVLVLGERLRTGTKLAVGIAAAGVLGMTVALGVVPWVALVLATTFALYGLLKKRADAAGPIEGLFGEIAAMLVPFAAFLGWRFSQGHTPPSDPGTLVLIAASGVVTIVPLLLFGAAAQRISLTAVGMLQYLAPTIQLGVGVWIYGETMQPAQLLGFASVWLALGVYTLDLVRASRGGAAAAAPATR